MLPLAHIKIFTKFALRYLFNLGVNHKIYTLTNAYSVVFPISYYTVISKCRNFGRATLSLSSTKIKFFTFYATLSKKFSSREQQYLDANGNSTTRSTCNYSLSKSFCKKINDNIFVVVKNFLTFVLPNLSSKVNHRFCKNIKRISVVFLNPYSFAVGRFGDLEKATLSLYLKVKIFYDAKPSRKLHTREQEYLVCNGNSTTRSTCNHFSDYSFQEFQDFCELMQPKHIQLNTIQQGKGFKIYFGLDKRRCFFGQGENFTQALIGLVQDMHYRIEA